MSDRPALRRLIDLPGVDALELKAVMKPAWAEPEARAEHPEIDELCLALFGLTPDQAEAVERPADWDDIETKPIAAQVFAFEDAGWDVTDKRRPLRMLGHYCGPLWLAIRGVAGALPFHPDDDDRPDRWGAGMAAEAARFRKR